MPISVQNNQENSYEKFKKFLNNPITKFSLSMAGGTALVGLIAKLIYDKIHQNNHQNKIYKELIINDVTLSVADQIWIDKNMILFAWKYPLCWHDNFMQFLVCPDIRCESYDSDDLIVMINWINEKLSKKYELVLLSNYFEKSQRGRLEHIGIDKYFTEYYGEKICKPNRQAFLDAIRIA